MAHFHFNCKAFSLMETNNLSKQINSYINQIFIWFYISTQTLWFFIGNFQKDKPVFFLNIKMFAQYNNPCREYSNWVKNIKEVFSKGSNLCFDFIFSFVHCCSEWVINFIIVHNWAMEIWLNIFAECRCYENLVPITQLTLKSISYI